MPVTPGEFHSPEVKQTKHKLLMKARMKMSTLIVMRYTIMHTAGGGVNTRDLLGYMLQSQCPLCISPVNA